MGTSITAYTLRQIFRLVDIFFLLLQKVFAMRKIIFYLFIAIIFVGGCARPYRKINMSAIPFKEYRQENKISYSLRQGVLYNLKNYYFARREQKKNMSLVAVKIVNKSELPVNINDLQFTCGAALPIQRVGIDEYYNAIKQKSALYWLYAVGFAVYPKPAVYTDPVSGTQVPKADNPKKFIKNGKQIIPLPFGLPVAAANYAIAYKANKKMMLDFKLLDLSNRVIQPFDSIQGILTFKNIANCGDIFITTNPK